MTSIKNPSEWGIEPVPFQYKSTQRKGLLYTLV